MALTIQKDTFTPFVNGILSRSSNTQMKGFLNRQRSEMEHNESEMFRRQVFFNGFFEESWTDLAVATIKMRRQKGTWKGMADSILKEHNLLFYKLLDFSTGVRAGSPIARLTVGQGTHSYSKESYKKIAKKHQDGLGVNLPARPVYSWLKRTQDTIFALFESYIWR